MKTGAASLVIPCYNRLAYTRQAIESVLEHTRHPYELIVVDNGSSDGTAGYLRALAPRSDHLTRYVPIFNAANRGVAAALNQAIDAARGSFLCHLNNDIIVTDPWLTNMVACAGRDDRIGIVGCCTNPVKNPNGGFPAMPGCSSPQEVQRTGTLIALANRGKYEPAPVVHGFCMLIKREVLDRIGRFDEEYYPMLTGEDVDFCYRAQRAGFSIVNALDAYVFHFYNATSGSGDVAAAHGPAAERERRARERFLLKWGTDGARYFGTLEQISAREKDRVRRAICCSPECEPA